MMILYGCVRQICDFLRSSDTKCPMRETVRQQLLIVSTFPSLFPLPSLGRELPSIFSLSIYYPGFPFFILTWTASPECPLVAYNVYPRKVAQTSDPYFPIPSGSCPRRR